MTVYEALIAVSEGRYQDIPECRAKKNLSAWSPQRAKDVLEEYQLNPSKSTLAKWADKDITIFNHF
jgi:hypothetical protein